MLKKILILFFFKNVFLNLKNVKHSKKMNLRKKKTFLTINTKKKEKIYQLQIKKIDPLSKNIENI